MINILVPMVKSNISYENNEYYDSQSLIEIAKKPIIQYVYDNFKEIKDAHFIFVIQKEENDKYHLGTLLKLLNKEADVIIANGKTQGAACSCLLAIDYINNKEELLIANCEQYINDDIADILESFHNRNLDGGIVTFQSIHPRWSYVRLNENQLVVETAEKRPISNYATAGIFYYKKGSDFVNSAEKMILKDASVNGNYYVCPAYNEMVLQQKIIGIHNINGNDYFSFSTKKGLDEFNRYVQSHLVQE